jgi:hypothetical protein
MSLLHISILKLIVERAVADSSLLCYPSPLSNQSSQSRIVLGFSRFRERVIFTFHGTAVLENMEEN